MSIDISTLLCLPAADRIQIIGELWDSLEAATEQIQIPTAHLDELDRRRARHLANHTAAAEWEAIEQRISHPNE